MDQCTKRGKTGIWSEAKHRKAYNRTDLLPTEGGVAGVGKGGGVWEEGMCCDWQIVSYLFLVTAHG